eukprot:8085390-Alexandrium_andersonii.AAC.1
MTHGHQQLKAKDLLQDLGPRAQIASAQRNANCKLRTPGTPQFNSFRGPTTQQDEQRISTPQRFQTTIVSEFGRLLAAGGPAENIRWKLERSKTRPSNVRECPTEGAADSGLGPHARAE